MEINFRNHLVHYWSVILKDDYRTLCVCVCVCVCIKTIIETCSSIAPIAQPQARMTWSAVTRASTCQGLSSAFSSSSGCRASRICNDLTQHTVTEHSSSYTARS